MSSPGPDLDQAWSAQGGQRDGVLTGLIGLVYGASVGLLFALLNSFDRPYNLAPSLHITLRSILSSLEIADAVLQLVFSSVERALGDSGSLLSRAVRTALKVGLPKTSKRGPSAIDAARELALPSGDLAEEEEDEVA